VSLNSPLDGVVCCMMDRCEWSVGPNSSDANGVNGMSVRTAVMPTVVKAHKYT